MAILPMLATYEKLDTHVFDTCVVYITFTWSLKFLASDCETSFVNSAISYTFAMIPQVSIRD